MKIKTIQTQQGLIVWDSFRGSFTMLMDTLAYLIECKVESKVENLKPILYLSFKMFDTDGFQEATRVVKLTSLVFEMKYKTEEINDHTLSSSFDVFFQDYIFSKQE